MSEELDVKKALKTAKGNLQSVVEEVKDTIATIRPEEPLLKKVRKVLPKPIRRRIKRRQRSEAHSST